MATRSGASAAVTWNAAHIVGSWSALNEIRSRSVVVVAISTSPRVAASPVGEHSPRSAVLEAAVLQDVYVVRQADYEEHDHEHEAHHSGALHHRERHRLAPDLLHDRPEDVPAVEWQEREQVHHGQGERDDRHDPEHVAGVGEDRLAGALVAPDDPVDLLALLRVDDLRGDRELRLGDAPEGA